MWRNQIELESIDAESWFQPRASFHHRNANESITQWLDLQAVAEEINDGRSPAHSVTSVALAQPWFKR
ncbi:hypothetical protein IQ268_22505 [Oculatella sp. LEGE 06141]|uniref:hypothetical protein n=1 Tax=Oculatella sp. LEGE 06141 TaxID=1828648 RepID=UPI00187FAB2F|nr:hypothetical protein [Oculatella sp. LEGE 06141]MBE9181337.1 hypothetical protein [Oculatella sp. LEGE 06141]